MLKRNYRTVVAAVLVGAALFSPLLCGMTCLEGRGVQAGAAVEVAPAAGEFLGEFVESGVVGCVLTHVILRVDASDWGEIARVGIWVWAGVETVRSVGVIGRRGA
jgi:hypothetical protein